MWQNAGGVEKEQGGVGKQLTHLLPPTASSAASFTVCTPPTVTPPAGTAARASLLLAFFGSRPSPATSCNVGRRCAVTSREANLSANRLDSLRHLLLQQPSCAGALWRSRLRKP